MAAGKGDRSAGQGGPGSRGTDGRGEGRCPSARTAPAVYGHRISLIRRLPSATVSAIPANIDGPGRGEVGHGGRVPRAERATVIEVFGTHTRADIEPVLEVLGGMAAGKGDRSAGQGGPGSRGTDGRGEGRCPSARTAPAVYGHRISLIRRLPSATVSAIPANIDGPGRGEVGHGGRVPRAERATVIEVFGTHTRADIEPVLEVLGGMAAGKGDRSAGQGGPGSRGTDGRGEGRCPSARTAPAVYGHRISLIRRLPSATVSAIPANIDGPGRGEVGHGGRVPRAERATVIEVFGTHTRADIEPVLEVLGGMAAGKGDRSAGQGGPGSRGTDGRGEGRCPSARTAPAVYGHRISLIRRLPSATVSAIPANIDGPGRGEVGHGGRVPRAERATVIEVFGTHTRADIEPVLEVLGGMAAGKGDRSAGQGGPGSRGTDGGRKRGPTAAATNGSANLFFQRRGAFVS